MEKVKFTALIFVIFLSGCSLLPNPLRLFKMGTPNQEQKYTYDEAIKVTPKVVKVVDNKCHIGNEIEYNYRTDWEQKEKEGTILQKAWRGLLQMGFIGIILAVLAFFFPPLAMILGFAGRATEIGTRKIVSGLDKALAKVDDPKIKKAIYDTLSSEFDPKTKMMVSKMKHKNR
jgi:hypothetical protein